MIKEGILKRYEKMIRFIIRYNYSNAQHYNSFNSVRIIILTNRQFAFLKRQSITLFFLEIQLINHINFWLRMLGNFLWTWLRSLRFLFFLWRELNAQMFSCSLNGTRWQIYIRLVLDLATILVSPDYRLCKFFSVCFAPCVVL